MSFVYNEAKRAIAEGELDLGSGGSTMRAMLVMTNTSADTQDDVNTISAFSTLDEMNGANYTRKILGTGQVVNEDAANDRAEYDADDITWSSLGSGARQVAGVLIYKFVTNDSDSVPVAYIDTGGFPFTANGGDVTISWNVEGILQIT